MIDETSRAQAGCSPKIVSEAGSAHATLVGQLTNREEPDGSLDEAPVLLMTRKDIIAHAVYNRFGEFQMEYEQRGRLQLCVYLDNGSKFVQVPLKKFAAEKPVGGDRLNLGPVAGKKKKTSPDTQ